MGFVTDPGIVAAGGVVRPNDCCRASDTDFDHEIRNSLTIADEMTLVQPPTIALVLIV